MKGRIALAGALVALGFALAASGASAAIPGNPWLDRNFLNIAHQGGEDEAPSNTMYALKSAVRDGNADMLEIDVHLTSDGHLVVLHDDTYTGTTCLPALCPGPTSASEPVRPASQIRGMTLAQVQALDAAHWFRPGTYSHDYAQPDSAFPFRGVRTGAKAPPAGYSADDFRTPTLKEVLDSFPNMPINIEIKMPKSYDPVNPYGTCGNGDGMPPGALCDDLDLAEPTTQALAALLTTPPYSARNDIIVVSFAQEPMAEFASLAPNVHRAPSLPSLSGFVFNGIPLDPDPVAFQVPPLYGGVKAPSLLLGQPFYAHANGYAVHVWTDGDQDETNARYSEMVSLGVDGIMTSSPRKLNEFLCLSDVPHPNGTSRCEPPAAKKKCKKGKRLKKGKCVKKKQKGKRKKGRR